MSFKNYDNFSTPKAKDMNNFEKILNIQHLTHRLPSICHLFSNLPSKWIFFIEESTVRVRFDRIEYRFGELKFEVLR
jgi:hypothetical protein